MPLYDLYNSKKVCHPPVIEVTGGWHTVAEIDADKQELDQKKGKQQYQQQES